ncbi:MULTISPECIES: hypothetical protein [Pseudomonas]|uniref:hypothetical protein n=1 Tax=Pseudomonas TaxID=286 RepID=UPI001BE96C33|nr:MULTISPECIES: hypothetical protein [Pseudomonas]MBT2340925.1 hypothetical protein [Pseudomonas fluorescens]MCD4532068.1 hypothetical protein [Pseudomonas sp. C3-2018]
MAAMIIIDGRRKSGQELKAWSDVRPGSGGAGQDGLQEAGRVDRHWGLALYGQHGNHSAFIVLIGENASRRFSFATGIATGSRNCPSRDSNGPTFR